MKTTLIGSLITALLKVLPEDAIKNTLDKFLDYIEDYVTKTPNKVDDIVLQLTDIIRKQLNIPDND